MSIPAHLTANMAGIDLDSLLFEWRWLVGPACEPVVMTALGDLFLRDAAGHIHFLDLMCGELKKVASSQEEFDALCEDRGRRRSWFASFLVMELRKLHGELAPTECYGCKIPLSLGGKLEPGNFQRTDTQAHYSVLGQLHQQTKHLPAGTKIDSIKIESEHEDTKPKSFWQKLASWGR